MIYPDYLPHHHLPYLLTEEQAKNPTAAITEFFDCYDFVDVRKRLCFWIDIAFSYGYLGRHKMLQILTLKEDLLPLLEAATILEDKGKATTPEDETELFQLRWFYAPQYKNYNPWCYQPHYLTERQYRHPYRVFKQCSLRSTLPEWKAHLDSLFYTACYAKMNGWDGSVDYSDKEKNAFRQARRLIMLVEAAHLVYVREQLGVREDTNPK